MKRLLTIGVFAFIGLIVSFSVNAQGDLGIKKNVLNNPYLEKLVNYLGPESILAEGLPQKAWGYLWNTDWELNSYVETSYFPNGNVHVELSYDIITDLPAGRWTYTYQGPNGTGQMTEMLGESNETGTWEYSMKYTLSYDANGNISEIKASAWTGEEWFIVFGSQMTYTYTPQQYITSVTTKTYDFLSGWVWDTKDIYTLDGNGYPTQVLMQVYDGAWADSSRYVDIDWYEYIPQIGYGSLEYYVEELWDGSNWITNYREMTDYDDAGGYVLTNQDYDGGWVNSFRETLTVQNNRPSLYKYEDWIDGAWVQTDGEKYTYILSGENVTEEIIQTWDSGLIDYVNYFRYVYDDFFYTTGIDKGLSESSFRIYPNPVGEELTVQLSGDVSAVWYIEVLTLTGQVVASTAVDLSTTKMISIPVATLPEGLYIMRATSGDQLITNKFLKN
ncbi:MAG: T9SS type A sorting domain-containing protein [Bacteroidales bacterium]|nr:T9SS type A sorting domain-containing protein [Bacteroidales bacterium]